MNEAFHLDDDGVIRVSEWTHVPWLQHGFGTRHAAGWTGMLATVKQVHGATVLAAEGLTGVVGPADALVTHTPGQLIAVKTADCVPLLVVDFAHRAVAAVHAGWRGTVGKILPKALDLMREQYGTDPSDLEVALGPCISACCFEVGPEVAQQFQELFPERNDLDRKTNVDLIEANRRLAQSAGISAERIYASDECTMCQPDRYFSYRREAEKAGRLLAMAGLRAELRETPI